MEDEQRGKLLVPDPILGQGLSHQGLEDAGSAPVGDTTPEGEAGQGELEAAQTEWA